MATTGLLLRPAPPTAARGRAAAAVRRQSLRSCASADFETVKWVYLRATFFRDGCVPVRGVREEI